MMTEDEFAALKRTLANLGAMAREMDALLARLAASEPRTGR
jgi:hypothetical protein